MKRLLGSVVLLAVLIGNQTQSPEALDPTYRRIEIDLRAPYPVGETTRVSFSEYRERLQLDAAGVRAKYKGKFARHPVAIAFVLLGIYDTGVREGAPEASTEAKSLFRIAIEHVLRDKELVRSGSLVYGFAFRPSTYKRTLPAGWSSAMAQGLMLSVMARAVNVFPDLADEIRTFGDSLLRPLAVDHRQGGMRVRVRLGSVEAPYTWYEEYPFVDTAPLTLSGFMFTLVGLGEYADAVGSPESLALFKAGAKALAAIVPLFNSSPISLYDLSFLTLPDVKPHLSHRYHGVHTRQLRTLAAWTGEELFACTSRIMADQEQGYDGMANALHRIKNGYVDDLKWSHPCHGSYRAPLATYQALDVCVVGSPSCRSGGRELVVEKRPKITSESKVLEGNERLSGWATRYGVVVARPSSGRFLDLFFRRSGDPGILERQLSDLRVGSRYEIEIRHAVPLGAVRLALLNASKKAHGLQWSGNRSVDVAGVTFKTTTLSFWAPPQGERLSLRLAAADSATDSRLKVIGFRLRRFDR